MGCKGDHDTRMPAESAPIRCHLKTERPAVMGHSDGSAPAAKPEVARARGGRPGGGGGFFRRDRRTAKASTRSELPGRH